MPQEIYMYVIYVYIFVVLVLLDCLLGVETERQIRPEKSWKMRKKILKPFILTVIITHKL